MQHYNDELLFEKDVVDLLVRNGWKDGILQYPTEQEFDKELGGHSLSEQQRH